MGAGESTPLVRMSRRGEPESCAGSRAAEGSRGFPSSRRKERAPGAPIQRRVNTGSRNEGPVPGRRRVRRLGYSGMDGVCPLAFLDSAQEEPCHEGTDTAALVAYRGLDSVLLGTSGRAGKASVLL